MREPDAKMHSWENVIFKDHIKDPAPKDYTPATVK
jgi:hypothetical protein